MGQKQTFAAQNVMSALPPIADMCSAKTDVRFVPIADMRFRHKTKRPPRSGLSENSITLNSISSVALLMLHQDLGAERHARVKIGDIVVDQPEAT